MNDQDQTPREETQEPNEPLRWPEPDRTDRIEKGEKPSGGIFRGVERDDE